jgi:hypothetical protein
MNHWSEVRVSITLTQDQKRDLRLGLGCLLKREA